MTKRLYDALLLKTMTLFETVTRTRLKDCFIDNKQLLTFVVDELYIGKAIGKNAANVKRLENLLKRKIKIIAFNPSPIKFIKNLIYPINAEIDLQDQTIIIKGQDTKTKGMLIGRNQSNIKNNLEIVQKYFKDIQTIKVI